MSRGPTVQGRSVPVSGRAVSRGPAIPDSVVEQWTAEGFDGSNNAWRGQLGGYDLTGGSATVETGPNGESVVRYSGSSDQAHQNTSIAVNYDQFVIAAVFRESDNSPQQFLFDSVNSEVQFQNNNGNNMAIKFGGSKSGGGTPDTETHLAFIYGPDFGSNSVDVLELDGSVLTSGDVGSSSIDGFMLGSNSGGGYPFVGDVLELVIYSNPTSEDINSERTRLRNSYNGVSF